MHGTQDVGRWLLHRTDDRRELAVMSYAERKAVQLARLYSSVKRVYFGFCLLVRGLGETSILWITRRKSSPTRKLLTPWLLSWA